LQAHVEDHETCSQCPYSACAALVKEHRALHSSRVQALINMRPEEVEAWREERRRNWPTEENVRRKREEEQQQQREQQQQSDQKNKAAPKRAAPERARQPRPEPRGPAKRSKNLLENLFSAERRMEADLVLQCFEHWAAKASE
jgi:RPA family protein